MRALKKTVVLLLLTVTAVVGGCSDGYHSREPIDDVPGHEFSTIPAVPPQPVSPTPGGVGAGGQDPRILPRARPR